MLSFANLLVVHKSIIVSVLTTNAKSALVLYSLTPFPFYPQYLEVLDSRGGIRNPENKCESRFLISLNRTVLLSPLPFAPS
jgi:hypothetical protein